MARDADDYNEQSLFEEEYVQVQDQKKKKLEARKRKNLIKLVGVCVLAFALLTASFMVLFSLNRKMPTAPPVSSGTSLPPVSSAPSQADSGVDSPSGDPDSVPAGVPQAADPAAWNLWLIGPKHPVEASFPVPELAQVVQDGVVYLFDARMRDAVVSLRDACNAANGGGLAIYSGFVGYEYQRNLYNYYVDQFIQVGFDEASAKLKAMEYADPPGTTENHTGLAVDFFISGGKTADPAFADTAHYKWLVEHAAEYGFVLRYTADKEGVTGVGYRPWHFRYVGTDEAKAMAGAGICLEEYAGKA